MNCLLKVSDKDSESGLGRFKGVDFAFFAAGSLISKEFAPKATEAGAVVIDNRALSNGPRCSLIVPEVNSDC